MKKTKVSITNPEELEKNLQYTSPATWITLGTVIAIIIALFVWSFVFKLKLKITGNATIKSGEVTLVVDTNSLSKLKVGQKVYINDVEGEILSLIGKQPVVSYFDLSDGDYQYTIVSEIKPIEFLTK